MPGIAAPISSFRCLVLATVAIALTSPLALAQGTRRDSIVQQLETQTVRGERGATVIGGASAHVVQLDASRSKPAPSLADLLRTMPSMLVRTNSRGEVELSVRGSESRQVGIMMNGMPLSPGWDGRADPSLVPLTGISRVTYVRSTATVLGGPNSLGGVVDLSFDDPTAGNLEPHLAIGTDHTGARQFATTVASSRAMGDSRMTWRVGGGLRQYDGLVRARGVTDPRGEPDLRTNTDSRQFDFMGSLGWTAGNGMSVAGMVSGYDAMRGVAPELHIASPRYWRYPEQTRRMAQLRLGAPTLTSALGTTTIEAGGAVLKGITHIQTFGDANYAPVDNTEDGDEQVNSARFAIGQRLPGGAEIKAAVTGNNVLYDETLGTAPSSSYRQDLLSAGIESNFLIGDRTLVTGGVVLDRGVTIYAGGKAPLEAKGLLGWRVGTTRLLKTTGTTRLHASVSSRGRFPALRELYSGALNRFEPNPDLKPENLLATEAGVSLGDATAVRGVNAQFTLFHHALDDGIVRVPFGATNRFQRVNRDETRTVGIETMLGWSAGVDAPAVTLDLIAQRVNIRDQTAGGAERKPEHMPNFRAMLDGTVPVGRGIVLGGNLTHIGSQYCVNPDSGNDDNLSAQTAIGFTAHRNWMLSRGRGFTRMRVLAGMDNIANAAVWEQCGLPRAGRTLRVGMELR